MLKPEQRISMFKVILSAEAQGNERMQIRDVIEENFPEFTKHHVASEMCKQLLDILSNDELLEKRYVIAQGIHQRIGQEGAFIKHLTDIVNHPDMFEDGEAGEEDV